MEYLLSLPMVFDYKKNPLSSTEHRSETLASFIGAKNGDRAVTKLRRMILVTKDLKSGLITVAVDSGSPSLSQQIDEKILAFLNDFVTQKNQTKGSIKARYASDRRGEVEKMYLEAENNLSRFLQTNRNYPQTADPAVKLQGFRLEQEAKLDFQLLTNIRMMEEQAKLEEKDNMPVINIIDSPNEPIDTNGPGRSFFVLGMMLCMATGRWLYFRYGKQKDFRALIGLKA
jgi:capsule polysaccharide export protein KpsE/RkpR